MQEKQKKKKLVILGTGLFAEEIADIAVQANKYQLTGFIEGIDIERCKQTLSGLPITWINDIEKLNDSYRGVCAVGATKRDNFILHSLSLGLKFTTIVHPSAQIFPTSSIDQGTIVSAGVVIAAHTKIGCHVIVNRGCLIGHHITVGNYVTISPGTNIGGKVTIGNNSYIGMGSIILDGISIGKNSVVGAGAVVTHDVPDFVKVIGVPARIVNKLK